MRESLRVLYRIKERVSGERCSGRFARMDDELGVEEGHVVHFTYFFE